MADRNFGIDQNRKPDENEVRFEPVTTFEIYMTDYLRQGFDNVV